jgi:pyrimidine-specific ribonucleoside hydrolase
MVNPGDIERRREPLAPPIPLVIDCDPGIDDAVAIALAVASPEVDLLGLTTVAGNVSLARSTSNARALLDSFGRPDVPVVPGAERGLVRAKAPHADVHGPTGLGHGRLPTGEPVAGGEHAVQFLARVLAAAPPRSVTIAAIAPLTNLALLVALHPELLDRIRHLVVMGTSSGPGNMTPHAEYNTWADPEAAQRVLGEPAIPVCVVELQTTRHTTLTTRQLDELRGGSARGALLASMIDGYVDQGRGARPLHDVLVTAAIVAPDVIQTRPASVEIDTSTSAQRGRSTFGPERDAPAPLRVSTDLDLERFRRLTLDRVAAAPS